MPTEKELAIVLNNELTLCFFGSDNRSGTQEPKEIMNALTTMLHTLIGATKKRKIKLLDEKIQNYILSLKYKEVQTPDGLIGCYDFRKFFSQEVSALCQQEKATEFISAFSEIDPQLWEVNIAKMIVLSQEKEFLTKHDDIMSPFFLKGKGMQEFLLKVSADAMKCMMYGFGNCLLRAALTFVEAIRQLKDIDVIHFVQLQPADEKGNKLEEINFIAVGNWPKDGYILVPWFENKKNRLFKWMGSVKGTPLENFSPSMDMEKSKFEIVFSSEGQLTKDIRNCIMETFDHFLKLRKEKIFEIRQALVELQVNFCGKERDSRFIKALAQCKAGPYIERYLYSPFTLFTSDKKVEDEPLMLRAVNENFLF